RALEASIVERPSSKEQAPRRRGLAMSLVASMSVVVLAIGGAAVAKTPTGEKASASLKAAYEHVVKLRADALARRSPPAPEPRQVVATGTEPEPVAAPAAPPVPAEPAAELAAAATDAARPGAAAPNGAAVVADADATDDDGEVDAKDAPAVPAADAAGVAA